MRAPFVGNLRRTPRIARFRLRSPGFLTGDQRSAPSSKFLVYWTHRDVDSAVQYGGSGRRHYRGGDYWVLINNGVRWGCVHIIRLSSVRGKIGAEAKVSPMDFSVASVRRVWVTSGAPPTLLSPEETGFAPLYLPNLINLTTTT